MNGAYLVPANSKRGKLIFNIFTPFDAILFVVGIFISMLMGIVVPISNMFVAFLVFLPGGMATLLVAPIPNNHNVMTFLGEIIKYYQDVRVYYWKGWSLKDGKEQSKAK